MEASDDDNPKLFKLTAAVTAIQPIIKAIQEVFAKYPEQESRRHAGQQFPVARVPQGGRTGAGRKASSSACPAKACCPSAI